MNQYFDNEHKNREVILTSNNNYKNNISQIQSAI